MMNRDPDPEGKKEKYTRATWARRALEEFNIKDWISVGIRDFDIEEIDFGISKDAEIILPKDLRKAKRKLMRIKGPVYISIDIDVLDPAIAPSVSVPIPMGLTMKQLTEFLSVIPKPLGFDIVELACEPNKHDRTAMAAAYLLREYLPSIYFD